jgi:hypothetical protein
MRRIIPLLATAALALGTSAFASGTASAAGGESLTCGIGGGGSYDNGTSSCGDSWPQSSYSIGYSVAGGSGAYTYAWTVPGASAHYGCGASDNYCSVTEPEIANDRYYTATVVITQGGYQATLSATAYIPAGCGSQMC